MQSFIAHVPLLMAASTFELGRTRWSSPQQCCLHCLRSCIFLERCQIISTKLYECIHCGSDGQCRPDLTRCIGLAFAVMASLKRIWRDKHLTLDTKLHLYQTLVLSVLLYATDTWTLLSADVRTLDDFHQKCLRQLLGIRWYDRVRNDEVGYYNGPV